MDVGPQISRHVLAQVWRMGPVTTLIRTTMMNAFEIFSSTTPNYSLLAFPAALALAILREYPRH